jgi:hypothetical protein
LHVYCFGMMFLPSRVIPIGVVQVQVILRFRGHCCLEFK